MDAELDQLRHQKAVVHLIETDPESVSAIGLDALDPSMRRPAAQNGRRQGRLAAPLLR